MNAEQIPTSELVPSTPEIVSGSTIAEGQVETAAPIETPETQAVKIDALKKDIFESYVEVQPKEAPITGTVINIPEKPAASGIKKAFNKFTVGAAMVLGGLIASPKESSAQTIDLAPMRANVEMAHATTTQAIEKVKTLEWSLIKAKHANFEEFKASITPEVLADYNAAAAAKENAISDEATKEAEFAKAQIKKYKGNLAAFKKDFAEITKQSVFMKNKMGTMVVDIDPNANGLATAIGDWELQAEGLSAHDHTKWTAEDLWQSYQRAHADELAAK